MKFIVINTSVVPEITEVRLYKETMDHIVQEHPEVPFEIPCLRRAITDTIVLPTHVVKSYGTSYVFVDAETTNASGDPLRVPVKLVEGTSGRVRTAYFATTTTSPAIIWRRT
jgi:hypothetical protein